MKHYVIQLGPVTLRRYNLTVHDLVQRDDCPPPESHRANERRTGSDVN